MPAAHTGGHYARQPRGGCGWPRTLRLITSSMRQGEHCTTCVECVECDAREGPQKVGPWLGWGWEACVSRAQHERTYQRTVVLTAATLWQGPEDRIDGVQEPLTGFTFYRVATLPSATLPSHEARGPRSAGSRPGRGGSGPMIYIVTPWMAVHPR